MSIKFRLLGKPGNDNALMIWINSGTKTYRVLFDCGENLLSELRHLDITSIDYLLFSHFHLDHAAGFDYFLRRNYDRPGKPVNIIGPAGTVGIIQNRLRGYIWNLVKGIPGEWMITEFNEKTIITYKLKTSEGFSRKHFIKKEKFTGILIDNENFSISSVLLNHIIPSAAYRITEKDYFNIDKNMLSDLNFPPGKWLELVKDMLLDGNKIITMDGKNYTLKNLRKLLLKKHAGESIAYMTDFIYDKLSVKQATALTKNCNTVFCESQYSSKDIKLAKKNYHLTAKQAAYLARKARANKLFMFHISNRYNGINDYSFILNEAKKIFPETFFPVEWNLD